MTAIKVNMALLFLVLSGRLIAQVDAAQQLRAEQEQARRSALLRTMDEAVEQMNQGEYAEAEEKFVYVLNNIKGVPSDLTFFFGKNSYMLQKYKQSVDWLSKYIQLKGTSGQFSSEAVAMLHKAEEEVLKARSIEASRAEEVLSQDFDIDCGPSGKVICPVCKGSTVIIRRGPFGNEYRSCMYCDQHGLLTCDEYNLLIRGELKPRQ